MHHTYMHLRTMNMNMYALITSYILERVVFEYICNTTLSHW